MGFGFTTRLARAAVPVTVMAFALLATQSGVSACLCSKGTSCSFEPGQADTAADKAPDSCCAPAESPENTGESGQCEGTLVHGCCCLSDMPLPGEAVIGPVTTYTASKPFFAFLNTEYPVAQGTDQRCATGLPGSRDAVPAGLPPPAYLLDCSLLI